MRTVYFDTSFYIWLTKADEVEAENLIRELHEIDVRPVCSWAVIEELLSASPGKLRKNPLLFERVSRLAPPFSIPDDASWAALQVDLDRHEQLRERLRECREFVASADRIAAVAASQRHAESWADDSEIGRRKLSPTSVIKALNVLLAPILRDLQHLDDIDEGQSQAIGRLQTLLSVADPREIQSLLGAERLTEHERAARLMRHVVGEERATQYESEARMRHSVVCNDDHGLSKAAHGEAAPKFDTALRDSRHMEVFLKHADRIQLLQIDRRQLRRIKTSHSHEMTRRGLVDRCFNATDLSGVVQELRERLGTTSR